METKNFIPEIILPGFLYLTIIVFVISPPSEWELGQFWKELSTAQVAVISTVIFVLSYSIGMITSRILSSSFSILEKGWMKTWKVLKTEKQTHPSLNDIELIRVIKVDPKSVLKTMENRHNLKSFYRSTMIAWLLLGFTVQQWTCSISITALIFWIIELSLIIAFLLQRNSFNSFMSALNQNPF